MNQLAEQKIGVGATLREGQISLNGCLRLGSEDNGKCFDFSSVSLIGDTDAPALVICGAKDITVRGLRLSGSGTGIAVSDSEEIRILSCMLSGFDTGISDSCGSLIADCELTDCAVGVRICGAGTVVKGNRISGGSCGIKACFEESEISAVMASGYNVIAAQNDISGAELSVCFAGISNSVILLNRLDSCRATACTNLYVAENTVGGALRLLGNRYLLANGNACGKLVQENNDGCNGDNLTDLSERATYGANEKLQPHINSEQFVGMPARTGVFSSNGAEETLAEYILREASESDCIIVPPGVYQLEDSLQLENLRGKTIYAYGVLRKMSYSEKTAMVFNDCRDTCLKGMFLASDRYPHIQGTVISCGERTYSFLADPGYLPDFSDSARFGEGAPGGIFRPGEVSPCSESYFQSRSYDPETGLNTVVGSNFTECAVGYRVAHRNMKGAGGVYMRKCSGMVLEDVTVYCSSGFSEFDSQNEVAPYLHRYAVGFGAAPLLEEGFDASRWEGMGLISKDCYGRLRGPKPLNSTCDATHSTNAKKGIRMVSCLLERMNDDGGNINAYYGTPLDFDAESRTLTYTFCRMYFERTGAKCAPWPFKVGDTVLLYGKNGRLICQASAIDDACEVGEDCFAVTLDRELTLPKDLQSVVLQNASGSGTGFLWDNVTVRNSLSFGVRIQANCGTVEHCSFINAAKGGIHIVPQYGYWPECGYASDVRICRNVFEGVSKISATNLRWSDGGFWLPLSIYTGDDLNHCAGCADPECCLHENITIEENLFGSHDTRYAVYLSAVRNLTMRRNRFLPKTGGNLGSDTQTPVWIAGGNGIVLQENEFPAGLTEPYRIDPERTARVEIS